MHTTRTDLPAATQPSLIREAGLPYFAIALIARFPYAMMVVGVLTLVVSARGSLAVGGLTSAMTGVGTALCGPLLGAAADRFGQRRTLLWAGTANSLLLLVMAWLAFAAVPDAALLVAAFAIGATMPQVGPLSRSRLVQLVVRAYPAARRARTVPKVMSYESAAEIGRAHV